MHDGHVHQHKHCHDHDHGCDHDHTHEHEAGGEQAKLASFLGYMLEHNRSHAEELAELAHKLYHSGGAAAADLIAGGVKDFEAGNGKLEEALKLIKTGNV
jgi:ABC-type Zn2+ transport system substrate-binding protein/surface adhesin